jgi:hypothetical protein
MRLGLDWAKIDLEQFQRGLEVEFEHGAREPETDVTHDDLMLTGRIAWAHLKEIADYYTRLDKLEAENLITESPQRFVGDSTPAVDFPPH